MANDPLGISSDLGTRRVDPIAAITTAHPIEQAESTKYYFCSVRNASMHNTDGKPIRFLHNVCAADLVYDQKYLDNEIARGHPYLSVATPEQVEQYKMTVDPKGAMRESIETEVRAEVEEKIRSELEAKIRAELSGDHASPPDDSAEKLANTDTTQSALDKLRAGIHSGSGKLVPQSTADVAEAMAGSGT